VLSATVLAIYVAQAAEAGSDALGSAPGTVKLIPASGSVSSTPTWATTIACPAGYQGSGLFSEVQADGSVSSIAQVVDGTAAPFTGTLQGTIAQIKSLGSIPNGGTQELFVICSSEQGSTGKTINVMSTYITYSADGRTYTTSASKPSTSGGGTGSASSGASASPGTGTASSPGSGSSSSSGNQQSSSSSPAPSPSAMDSSFAVTG
jgi:hypothetical protein